nr:hypothetical protein [Methylobacterium sp. ZNC0032]
MPILILARGLPNTGKTTTIKRIVLERVGVRMTPKRGDIQIALNAYWKQGERRDISIGLASGGDTEQAILNNIDFFEADLPEVMVMACRAKTASARPYRTTLAFVKKHQIDLIEVPFEERGDEEEEAYYQRKGEEIVSKIP